METFRIEPTQTSRTMPRPAGWEGLSSDVLYRNACWYTRIRWIVIAVFVAFGSAARWAPGALRTALIEPPALWPWVLAVTVAIVNGVVIAWLRWMPPHETKRGAIKVNIWFQIVADLLVLTVLVHLTGNTNTVLPFAYLFHMTLACIFFGRRDSLLVTLISAALFLGTVGLEWLGILSPAGVMIDPAPRAPELLTAVSFVLPAVFVWLVVWFLTSSLSENVRLRDRNLAEANQRILLADEAINRQMLRVTHDLKAPFAGIESNIQILKRMHWDETTENVRHIIGKIEARSASLRARIGDILMLGGLRSAPDTERADTLVNLRQVLSAVARDLQGMAQEKGVTVELGAANAIVVSDERQLKILFSNLISNAIVYSRDRGTVTVDVRKDAGRVSVRVADRGIGISAEALPHVFEDFYRAPEAAAVNPNSTGLGLAIIRQVVINLRLTLDVQSEPGEGTRFAVTFPSVARGGPVATATTRQPTATDPATPDAGAAQS